MKSVSEWRSQVIKTVRGRVTGLYGILSIPTTSSRIDKLKWLLEHDRFLLGNEQREKDEGVRIHLAT